jgi:hypothetical protein
MASSDVMAIMKWSIQPLVQDKAPPSVSGPTTISNVLAPLSFRTNRDRDDWPGRVPRHSMRARAPITAPGAATSMIAALLYLGTCPDNGTAICALMSTRRPKHTTSHVRIVAGKSGTQSRIRVPILRHTSGPSSQLSGPIAGFWRVLKTRKDSDSHPPPLSGGGLPVCTGPVFQNCRVIEAR